MRAFAACGFFMFLALFPRQYLSERDVITPVIHENEGHIITGSTICAKVNCSYRYETLLILRMQWLLIDGGQQATYNTDTFRVHFLPSSRDLSDFGKHFISFCLFCKKRLAINVWNIAYTLIRIAYILLGLFCLKEIIFACSDYQWAGEHFRMVKVVIDPSAVASRTVSSGASLRTNPESSRVSRTIVCTNSG